MNSDPMSDEIREPSLELFVELVVGFAKAAACYPWLLLVCAAPVAVIQAQTIGLDFDELMFLVSAACVASLILGVVTSMVGAILAGVSGFFCHTLRIRVSPVPYGFFLGGMLGCFAFGLRDPITVRASSLWFLILGPLLAMVCGQVGGVMSAKRYLRMRAVANWQPSWARDDVADGKESSSHWAQFSISQMLILTVWIAIMVWLLKASGSQTALAFLCQFLFCVLAQFVMYRVWNLAGAVWDRLLACQN